MPDDLGISIVNVCCIRAAVLGSIFTRHVFLQLHLFSFCIVVQPYAIKVYRIAGGPLQ